MGAVVGGHASQHVVAEPLHLAGLDGGPAVAARPFAPENTSIFRTQGQARPSGVPAEQCRHERCGDPLKLTAFKRIVAHMNQVFPAVIELDETTVLERGFF